MTRLLNHPQVKPLLSDEHFSVDGTLDRGLGEGHSGAFARRTAVTGMARTSMVRSARTIPIRAPPIPTAGYIARRRVARRGCPIWDMSPWRTATDWRWPVCSASYRHRRAARVRGDARDQTPAGRPSHHGGRGQGLRHHRSCARLRAANVTPHVTQNNGLTKTGRQRRSAIDGRTTRHTGYAKSQSRWP